MSNEWLPTDDNTVQWSGTPGLSTVSGSLIGGSIVILVGVGAILFEYLTQIGVITSIVIGGAAIVYGVAVVLRTEYVITEQSVWKRTSLFGTDTTRVKISDVQNVSYNRSAIGSFTGKGNVVIDVAGSDDIEFKRVDGYKTVHELLSESTQTASEYSDIPGSLTQWKKIRDEITALNNEVTSKNR